MFTFGPFCLDRRNELLWQGKEQRHLTRKALAVLTCLVEHAGQLMTKEAVLEAVWPDTYVSDAALVVCIREIRQALGDRPRMPQYIETVYGRGYRFIAPVTLSEPASPGQTVVERSPMPMVRPEVMLEHLSQLVADALKSRCQLGATPVEGGIGQATSDHIALDQAEADVSWRIDSRPRHAPYQAGEFYLTLMQLPPELEREVARLATQRLLALVVCPIWGLDR